MGKNSAEYMRAYRARKKSTDRPLDIDQRIENYRRVVLELEDEIHRLKTELASRPTAETVMALDADAFEERMRTTGMEAQVHTALSRKTQQAERDAILRKINRGG